MGMIRRPLLSLESKELPVSVRACWRRRLQEVRDRRSVVDQRGEVAAGGRIDECEVAAQKVPDLGSRGILRRRCVKVNHSDYEVNRVERTVLDRWRSLFVFRAGHGSVALEDIEQRRPYGGVAR